MNKTVVTIPPELIPEFEAWGKMTARLFGSLRQEAGLVPKGVPKDQGWFWTSEWQAGEKEVDKALARGEYVEFDNVEDALAYLHAQV